VCKASSLPRSIVEKVLELLRNMLELVFDAGRYHIDMLVNAACISTIVDNL
jgi:hypothetical protein